MSGESARFQIQMSVVADIRSITFKEKKQMQGLQNNHKILELRIDQNKGKIINFTQVI